MSIGNTNTSAIGAWSNRLCLRVGTQFMLSEAALLGPISAEHRRWMAGDLREARRSQGRRKARRLHAALAFGVRRSASFSFSPLGPFAMRLDCPGGWIPRADSLIEILKVRIR